VKHGVLIPEEHPLAVVAFYTGAKRSEIFSCLWDVWKQDEHDLS
jgi:hypothetical protein